MKISRRPDLRLLTASLAAAGLLVACGGGDDPVETTLSGSVVKGPVNAANVCAYKATSAGKGDLLKCVTTGAAGTYSLVVDYVGDIVVEAKDGTYVDEATGATKTLSDPMQVVVAANGGSTTGIVTPLTTVAYSLSKSASGGVTSVNFGSSATAVGTMFNLGGVSITTTLPVVTAGTTQAYGQLLRAVSQFNANGGTLASFFAFNNPSSLQALFNAAFAQANAGFTANFNLTLPAPAPAPTPAPTPAPSPSPSPAPSPSPSPAPAPTPAPSPSPAPAPAPTPAPAPAPVPSGTKNLVLTVNAAGVTSTVNVGQVPAPTTQAEFCGALTNDVQLKQIATTTGGTLTVNSCSFSGSTGNVSLTINMTTPIAFTLPYTVVYNYN